MRASYYWRVSAALALTLAGCGPTTQTQLTRCQNDKKTLVTRISDEQKRVQTLTTQNEQLASRLAESEKQLARLYQQSSGRYVSSAGPAANLGPSGPSASITERPNRLIPLGSPSGSSHYAPATAPESATRSLRTNRTRVADESNSSSSGDAPSLAAPSNGRSESGWLPKTGGGSAGGGSAVDGSFRPTGTPRR